MAEKLYQAVRVISEKMVLPLLKEMEKEVFQKVSIHVFIINDGHKIEVLSRDTDGNSSGSAEVRLLLKEGVFPNQFRFNGECITSNFANKVGFSGFSMKGNVFIDKDDVEVLSRTNRYNVWEWGTKFRI
ncbi:MAG: hypothetical protein P8179_14640 [Candidatus Thiodiazotropha sp.]|jgi:hypothetical protein